MRGEDTPTAPAHFRWIDALRGVAALTVLIFHYHHFYLADYSSRSDVPPVSAFPYENLLLPIYTHGFWAVELFWVISGFVFAHVYLPRKVTSRQFLVARFARLYPLHAATLIYVAGLQLLSLFAAGHWQIYGNNDARHFLLNLFMASNLTTQSRGLSFNGPIWSVSLEIAAYALFLMTLSGIRRSPFLLPVCCCLVGFWIGASDLDLPVLRLVIFTCAGYFFAGTAVYGLCIRLGWRPASILIVGCAAFAAAFLGRDVMADNAIAILVSLGLVLLAATFDLMPHATWRPPSVLGDISYSIYLVHVPLQMTVLLVADVFWGRTRGFADTLWLLPVYAVMSIALALLTHRVIEKPIGQWLRHRLGGPSN